MYLLADGTTLTQQRTLALYVVALCKGVAGNTMKIGVRALYLKVLKGVAGDTMKIVQ